MATPPNKWDEIEVDHLFLHPGTGQVYKVTKLNWTKGGHGIYRVMGTAAFQTYIMTRHEYNTGVFVYWSMGIQPIAQLQTAPKAWDDLVANDELVHQANGKRYFISSTFYSGSKLARINIREKGCTGTLTVYEPDFNNGTYAYLSPQQPTQAPTTAPINFTSITYQTTQVGDEWEFNNPGAPAHGYKVKITGLNQVSGSSNFHNAEWLDGPNRGLFSHIHESDVKNGRWKFISRTVNVTLPTPASSIGFYGSVPGAVPSFPTPPTFQNVKVGDIWKYTHWHGTFEGEVTNLYESPDTHRLFDKTTGAHLRMHEQEFNAGMWSLITTAANTNTVQAPVGPATWQDITVGMKFENQTSVYTVTKLNDISTYSGLPGHKAEVPGSNNTGFITESDFRNGYWTYVGMAPSWGNTVQPAPIRRTIAPASFDDIQIGDRFEFYLGTETYTVVSIFRDPNNHLVTQDGTPYSNTINRSEFDAGHWKFIGATQPTAPSQLHQQITQQVSNAMKAAFKPGAFNKPGFSISTKPSKQIDGHPHTCPSCNSKAYVGFQSISCSNHGCKHGPKYDGAQIASKY